MFQKLPVPALLIILELTSAGYAAAGGRGGPRPVPPMIRSAVVDPGWPCGLRAARHRVRSAVRLVCETVHRQAPGIALQPNYRIIESATWGVVKASRVHSRWQAAALAGTERALALTGLDDLFLVLQNG
jgi:hypothetical protein